MTEQELHIINTINSRLNELKDHLGKIKHIVESHDQGTAPKFTISTGHNHHVTELKYDLLPISPEDFLNDYKIYLEKEIAKYQKQFNEL